MHGNHEFTVFVSLIIFVCFILSVTQNALGHGDCFPGLVNHFLHCLYFLSEQTFIFNVFSSIFRFQVFFLLIWDCAWRQKFRS